MKSPNTTASFTLRQMRAGWTRSRTRFMPIRAGIRTGTAWRIFGNTSISTLGASIPTAIRIATAFPISMNFSNTPIPPAMLHSYRG